MKENPHYLVLAYYDFVAIERPEEEVLRHKIFFEGRNAAGRIYLSEQGINGQLSASFDDASAYMEWMHADSRFQKMEFKIHLHHELVFPRMTIKYRRQLVAIDEDVDLFFRGESVSPRQWREMLENGEEYLLLDVRNQYEWEIGHFEGAELPVCENFREFPLYGQKLVTERDPEVTKIMMYCTGGIRCELFSAVLKKNGFKHVYQLHGGVLQYGLEEGNVHWRGKLFVFDDRLAVPVGDIQASPIAVCHHCSVPSDKYYNCANMDCNELFLCCPTCLTQFKGCCQEACMQTPRLRPHNPHDAHKPFRKKHTIIKAN